MNGDRIATVLDEARDLMAGGHWCKGRNHHKGLRAYCLRGAVCQVVTGQPERHDARAAEVLSFLAERVPERCVTLFNDTAKSFAAIETLLLRAAAEARA